MNDAGNKLQTRRLAMRAEGLWWNAYYAPPNTMEGAQHLGSILLTAIRSNPERKLEFFNLMKGVVADQIQEQTGLAPDWQDPVTAPEHERSGGA